MAHKRFLTTVHEANGTRSHLTNLLLGCVTGLVTTGVQPDFVVLLCHADPDVKSHAEAPHCKCRHAPTHESLHCVKRLRHSSCLVYGCEQKSCRHVEDTVGRTNCDIAFSQISQGIQNDKNLDSCAECFSLSGWSVNNTWGILFATSMRGHT